MIRHRRRRVGSRWLDVRRSMAIYDLMSAELRRVTLDPVRRDAALAAAPIAWKQVLWVEGCGARLQRALRRSGTAALLPASLRSLLREVSATALRGALLLPAQLAEIAATASAHGIRLIALKGAARLVAGEMPGTRSVADIDLLAGKSDAAALHRLLRDALGYEAAELAPAHHLPRLRRAGALPVEIHTRLADRPTPLTDLIRRTAREMRVHGTAIAIPSSTALLLHAMEHAALVHWAHRYRLRDIADVAGAWIDDVHRDAVVHYVRASPHRATLETLLAAAHELEPRVPRPRDGAWRTVRRTACARLAGAAFGAGPASRTSWVAGVLGEASPASLARLGRLALRKVRRTASVAFFAALGCSEPTPPGVFDVSPFVFVSDADGNLELYRFRNDSVVRLTTNTADDTEPDAAAGRLVFASRRDGNAEIYIADLDANSTRRVTNHPGADGEPALSPHGELIAFVSNRTGSPRLWVVDSAGANADTVRTGSSSSTPEHAPAWSPTGHAIAFTSTRTGISQVFLLPAGCAMFTSGGCGDAMQLTHESSGAFDPAWNADGTAIAYVAGFATPRLNTVSIATGAESPLAADPTGVGDPSCAVSICLAVTNPYGIDGDLVVFRASGGAPAVLIRRAGKERQPAFVR